MSFQFIPGSGGSGGSGDMAKADYDADDNSKVDVAETAEDVDPTGTAIALALSGKAASDHSHDAAAVTFTPTVLTDWDGDADPGDVDDALDQLAERIDAVEGASVDAGDVTYTPNVLTDWDGDADPGDVDDALDQLAERVDDLEGAGYLTAVDAGDVSFTPNVLTDWDSDADPGDVDAALDQLAERVDDLEGAGYLTTRTGVYRNLWIGAGAMIARVTNGAATGSVELATNDIMLDVFDFDTTTEEGVGFWANFGDQWDAGTVKVKFYWTAASGENGVVWGIAGQSYANDDAIDQALGTQKTVADALITANDMHISAASAELTVADATAGEPCYFEVTREVGDENDTLAVDARLIGVMIQFKESATEQTAW